MTTLRQAQLAANIAAELATPAALHVIVTVTPAGPVAYVAHNYDDFTALRARLDDAEVAGFLAYTDRDVETRGVAALVADAVEVVLDLPADQAAAVPVGPAAPAAPVVLKVWAGGARRLMFEGVTFTVGGRDGISWMSDWAATTEWMARGLVAERCYGPGTYNHTSYVWTGADPAAPAAGPARAGR